MNCLRHHAAGDLVVEPEAAAARQRLDVEHHVAELAVPARLLLVPAAHLDALLDRLLVGQLPRLGFRLHAVLALQPLERHAQVHLALAPQHHLVRVLGVLEPERGVLLHQPGQRARQLHLVLAVLDADGDAVDGFGRLGRLDLRAAALLGRQRLAGVDLLEPSRAPPCRRPWRDRASWSPAPASRRQAAARSSDRAPCTIVPSPNSPASTRTRLSLPPCAV